MTAAAERVTYGACNLCEAICGLEFKVRGDQIVSIRGDHADPLSRGHICPKAVALKDIYEDPNRLRRPMRRNGKTWEEISWDAAFDLVAERLVDLNKRHGANAVAAYLGNPSVHNYGSLTHAQHFLGPLKTRNRFSATSVDQLPHQLLGMWMYGHQFLVPIADIDRTNYFLVLGANPMASNGSLMTVPDFRNRLKALQARGGRMVVLDPRRTETAQVADEHHFIRPGTDAAFLIVFLRTLFDEGLARPGPLAAHVDGLDAVRTALQRFDVAALAGHCGVPADTIRRLAREFAQADGAACYGRIGVSIQRFGTLSQWLIQLINIATGNLDRRGGMLFTKPAVDLVGAPGSKPGHFGAWKSRVRGLPEFAGELPVAALAEEITTPGDGQVRALITIAGNPVLSTPGGSGLERALETLDFMVSVDLYLNETTRHAHVILPPTCAMEHDHYDMVFHVFAVRNTARYSEPLMEKAPDARHDWEIFTELGARIGKLLGTAPRPAMRPDQVVDAGLQFGPYGAGQKHAQALSLRKLKDNPHGVDLGPLEPQLPQRLQHPDKRVRCALPEMIGELDAFAAEMTGARSGALVLIGRRHVRSNNSWMHNYERLVKGPARHQLLMNPGDMASRGISDGGLVRVRSRVGEVQIEASASDDMMPGVVSLPHGWGHGRPGTRMTVANAHPGASNNDLTDPQRLDFSGNAALNGTPVEVEPVAA